MLGAQPTPRIAEALLALQRGETRETVAKRLGVSTNAVAQAIERWRDWTPPLERRQERLCLTCRQPFFSEGWGNRICRGCKTR